MDGGVKNGSSWVSIDAITLSICSRGFLRYPAMPSIRKPKELMVVCASRVDIHLYFVMACTSFSSGVRSSG
eukprot:9487186-Pyramimonas_sp.AAC.1